MQLDNIIKENDNLKHKIELLQNMLFKYISKNKKQINEMQYMKRVLMRKSRKLKFRKKKITNLEAEIKVIKTSSDKKENNCKICFTNSIEIAIIPCGHLQLCYECFSKINDGKCPFCKQEMEGILKVYP